MWWSALGIATHSPRICRLGRGDHGPLAHVLDQLHGVSPLCMPVPRAESALTAPPPAFRVSLHDMQALAEALTTTKGMVGRRLLQCSDLSTCINFPWPVGRECIGFEWQCNSIVNGITATWSALVDAANAAKELAVNAANTAKDLAVNAANAAKNLAIAAKEKAEKALKKAEKALEDVGGAFNELGDDIQ